MSGPLAGLRVVEFEGMGPAPLAGQFLCDLGAKVTLITRKSAPHDPTDINNRGKRSVALNLKSSGGLAIARKLVNSADVLIEGFRPGVVERLGLGPDDFPENPGLIFARMTGWGQDGPLAQSAGHDINYLGLTGVLHAIGPADAPPPPPLNIGADYGGGAMFLLFGIMAALYERSLSGKGQVIDAAMVEGASAMMSGLHAWMARGWWSEDRETNKLDGAAPFYRTYACADGKFLAVGAIETPFFAKLVELAGLPDSHKETQLNSVAWSSRREIYAEVFRQKTRDEWAAIFEGSDACCTPVLTWSEAPKHPHLSAREAFVEIDGIVQPSPTPRFSRTSPQLPKSPHAPGTDTDDVLAELGLKATEIAGLRREGALT